MCFEFCINFSPFSSLLCFLFLVVFGGASVFNGVISEWDMSSVTSFYKSTCTFLFFSSCCRIHENVLKQYLTFCPVFHGSVVILFLSMHCLCFVVVFQYAAMFNSDVSKWELSSLSSVSYSTCFCPSSFYYLLHVTVLKITTNIIPDFFSSTLFAFNFFYILFFLYSCSV